MLLCYAVFDAPSSISQDVQKSSMSESLACAVEPAALPRAARSAAADPRVERPLTILRVRYVMIDDVALT